MTALGAFIMIPVRVFSISKFELHRASSGAPCVSVATMEVLTAADESVCVCVCVRVSERAVCR